MRWFLNNIYRKIAFPYLIRSICNYFVFWTKQKHIVTSTLAGKSVISIRVIETILCVGA